MKMYLYNFRDIWIIYNNVPFNKPITDDEVGMWRKSALMIHECQHTDLVVWFRSKVPNDQTMEIEV